MNQREGFMKGNDTLTQVFPCEFVCTTHRGLDLHGSVCILESVVGVLIAQGRGTDIGHHDSAAVPTEGILQKTCQFTVTVRYIARLTLGAGAGDVYTMLIMTTKTNTYEKSA